MCVAVVLYTKPDAKDVECMFLDNPHGAGLAWQELSEAKEPVIRFVRGLMTYEEVVALLDTDKVKYPALMHFRWATKGAKTPEWTHPFPIGPRALMGELTGDANQVLIHNGIWDSWHHYVYKMERDGIPPELIHPASDTAIAAYMVKTRPEILTGVDWATALAKASVEGIQISTRGHWQTYKGNSYSNLKWLGAKSMRDASRSMVHWDSFEDFKDYYDRKYPAGGEYKSSGTGYVYSGSSDSWNSKAYKYLPGERLDKKVVFDDVFNPDAKPPAGWVWSEPNGQWLDLGAADWGRLYDKPSSPANKLPEDADDVVSEDPELVNEYLNKVAEKGNY